MTTKSASTSSLFASFVFYSLGFFSLMNQNGEIDLNSLGFLSLGTVTFLFGVFSHLISKDMCKMNKEHEKNLADLRKEIETKFLKKRP